MPHVYHDIIDSAPAVSRRGRAHAVRAEVETMKCAILQSSEELARAAPAWRRLEERAPGDIQAFQTAEWGLAWAEAMGQDDTHECRPRVVMVTDATGEPLLVWPLMTENYPLGLKVISPLSDPFGQYADILTVLDGERLKQALNLAVNTLRKTNADLLRLRHVRSDSTLGLFARDHLHSTGEDIGAPWLDLTPFSRPEELDGRYNRTQRRRRRKIHKNLQRYFGAEPVFERVTDGGEIRHQVIQALRNKRLWLDEKGLVSRALFRRETVEFFCALARHSTSHEKGLEFCLTVLRVGDEALSWEIGMRYHGRHYAYLTAHKPELTDFSIGRLHMDLSQKLAIADGMKAFDLLVPNDPHKHSWSSHVEPVRNHFLPLTLRGFLAGHGYLRFARSLMRRTYYALPSRVRRILQEWKHGRAD